MTIRERLRGVLSTLKRNSRRTAEYTLGGVVVAWVAVLTMASPVAAAGICSIPGAQGPLSLGFGLLVSVIALIAIFKFGASFVKAITGGGRGNAKLRLGIIVAIVGLFVALGANSIVPWLMQQLGGGPGSVDLQCMMGGTGGGGGGNGAFLLLAGAPAPVYSRLRQYLTHAGGTDE